MEWKRQEQGPYEGEKKKGRGGGTVAQASESCHKMAIIRGLSATQ